MRRNIYDILNNGNIDLKREYSRIYDLFFLVPYSDGFSEEPLVNYISENFLRLNKNLIHRCLSLEDFDETYGYHFVEQPHDFDIGYLISFAEYVANFTYAFLQYESIYFSGQDLCDVIEHVRGCMEDVGYELVEKDGLIIFVEKNPAAISVAEIVNDELSYSVLEYNHHTMKGDLTRKKAILKNMADDIENDRKNLSGINKNFTSDLFQLLNKFIRHDNAENQFISKMSSDELESVYDDIYQMWLLAKMQLEQAKRNNRLSVLIDCINGN